jgi:hypothetical protein
MGFRARTLLTACLLHYDPASYTSQARLSFLRSEAVAKASLQGRGSVGLLEVCGGRPETEAIYPCAG